jgi:hypothetical protein
MSAMIERGVAIATPLLLFLSGSWPLAQGRNCDYGDQAATNEAIFGDDARR